MDPNLVGTACFQPALHMGIARIAGQNGPVGHRLPAVFAVNGHLFPVHRMAADGSVHSATVFPKASHRHRLVHPGQGVILELGGQGQMGTVVFSGDDQARGVPVNAVDDAGAKLPVVPGERGPTVVQQGVDQGPVWVSGVPDGPPAPPAC